MAMIIKEQKKEKIEQNWEIVIKETENSLKSKY